MKNIHVLPTNKPSKLATHYEKMRLIQTPDMWTYEFTKQNIYITNDEEIKEGDWCLYLGLSMTCFKLIEIDDYKLYWGSREYFNKNLCKKIILTTDPKLIEDKVQQIDDEFLEWFVKNPSCEEVEVLRCPIEGLYTIIPKEEPKQETLEEATFNAGEKKFKQFRKGILEANKFDFVCGFTAGAKWQQERSYSEEELHLILGSYSAHKVAFSHKYTYDMWFEQFKKK